MLIHPQFNPVAISVGPLAIHWYGLMYLMAFLQFWWLGKHRILSHPQLARNGWTVQQLDDLLFYGVLGVILGGRLGQVLFYEPGYYFSDPARILAIWQGGMSFHGGFIGVLLATAWFARRQGKTFFELMDFIAPLVPIGLGAGRIGNFINAELWGKASDLPWAMVFPTDPQQLPRHPSQLYQFALEGLALFVILWLYTRKPRPTMAVSGLFAICYGSFRILVEFVRVPDAQLGYLAFGWLTMGQLLSLPMIAVGVLLMVLAYRRQAAA